MNLRDYQHQAISDLRSAMQQGAKSPLLCLPTGGGKTVILATIAPQAAAKSRRVKGYSQYNPIAQREGPIY